MQCKMQDDTHVTLAVVVSTETMPLFYCDPYLEQEILNVAIQITWVQCFIS